MDENNVNENEKELFIPRNRAERRMFAKKAKLKEKDFCKMLKSMTEEKKQEFFKTYYEKLHKVNEERGNCDEGIDEGN